MITQAFARFVKEKRKEKKIKMRDIYTRARISDSFVYLIEKGVNCPSLATATRLLEALDESWESFMEYSRES